MQVKELNELEMQQINGGALTAAFINAITSVVNTIFELGKETGSAIRRLMNNEYCAIN